jgi:hypothetical protein
MREYKPSLCSGLFFHGSSLLEPCKYTSFFNFIFFFQVSFMLEFLLLIKWNTFFLLDLFLKIWVEEKKWKVEACRRVKSIRK